MRPLGLSEESTNVLVTSQLIKPHNLSLCFLKIPLDLTFYLFPFISSG
jgi:hypothetical protein